MTKDTEILSVNQELFTVVTNGESGVSIRGLARLSGLDHSTISKWFKFDLVGTRVPEEIRLDIGSFTCQDWGIKVRGQDVKIVPILVAIRILGCAAFVLGNEVAKVNYVKLCERFGLPTNQDLIQTLSKAVRKDKSKAPPCFVYMIQDSGSKACKIGVSNDPISRLANLQTAFPYQLNLLWAVPGSFKEEKALHKALADFQLRGEWFDSIVFSLVNPAQITAN